MVFMGQRHRFLIEKKARVMHAGLVIQHCPLYWKPGVCRSQVDSDGMKVSRHCMTKWASRSSGILCVSSVMDTRVDTAVTHSRPPTGRRDHARREVDDHRHDQERGIDA